MLTEHLERCNKFISLDPVERPEFISHYDRVQQAVINKMKNTDDLFNRIFHRTELSGSYADQLKVSEPNEYDVLMILKLHNPIVLNVGRPGYVAINVTRRCIGIKRISDSSGYVMQNKVLGWLRGIMKRIFPSPCQLVRFGVHEYRIKHDVNGPANTLTIQYASYSNDSNSEFSIDFVGALEFPVKEVWMADACIRKQSFLNSNWNAIPKPRKPTPKPIHSQGQRSPNVDAKILQQRRYHNPNKSRDWICSYAEIERDLIHHLQFIKPLIRIFKKIRDTHQMTNLKSYYIKQIFIHERMTRGPDFWKQSLGELFVAMLGVIIRYLENKKLPFYWHQELNLFGHLSREQMKDIEVKFKRIRDDIGRYGPDYIYQTILTDAEQRRISDFV